MRVLAAMSGGVDSAVAAARAAEQGHDVTGIHLALSRNPKSYRTGARGCCTIEDANDARRAADVIGIPFYVWDLSERFHEDVVEDFLSEYAEGRTPNPCLRCNEKIKFAAVLDRAIALGFDAVVTGHYAQLRTGADGLIEMHRAEDMSKDQSYVLGVLTQDQLAHSMFPLGDTPKSRDPRGGRAPRAGRRRQAGQPRHLLHQRRRHRRLARRQAAREVNRGGVDRRLRRRGARRARGLLALHDRPAQGPADRHAGRRRPAALRARHRAGLRHGHRRPARGARGRRARARSGPAGAGRPRARRPPGVHRAAARPRRRAPRRGDASTATTCRVDLLDPASGIAPGQAVVVYDGSRVVGSATISATRRAAATPRRARERSHRHRLDARRGLHRARCGSSPRCCPTCRTCPSCPAAARSPT